VAIDITVALAAEEPGGGGDGDGRRFFAAIGNFFEAIGRALGGLLVEERQRAMATQMK